MRKLLFAGILLLCNLPLQAQTITAAKNADDSGSGSASSLGTSSTLNIAAHDLVIVTCHYFATVGTTMTASDTGSTNTFVAGPDARTEDSSSGAVEMFYVLDAVAKSSDTISCNYGASVTYRSVYALQVSGTITPATLDAHAHGQTAGSSLVTGTFSTTDNVEVVAMAAVWGNVGVTCTAGTNFTLQNVDPGGVGCDETWITSSSQSGITGAMSTNSSNNYATQLLTFKAAGGGSAAPTQVGAFSPGP